MMQSLVNGGLEEGLNARNSTVLMWVTQNYGGSSSAAQVYNYFTNYFSDGYAGYYAQGVPYMNYPYYGMVGFVDLTTGVIRAFSGTNIPSVSQLLAWADEANP